MPSGAPVVAGPEVDMAEFEDAAAFVDLNLNLGLPARSASPHRLALELALGHGPNDPRPLPPSHTLRPNWPRFEPSMSGFFLSVHPDSDPLLHHQGSVAPGPGPGHGINPGPVGSDRQRSEARSQAAADVSETEFEQALPGRAARSSARSPFRQFEVRHRFRRYPRQVRRSRQAPHVSEPVESQPTVQIASPGGSNTALHIVSPNDSRPSVVIFRSTESVRNEEESSTCPDRPISTTKESMPDSNPNGNVENEKGCQVADFECNICLDMAKEPVVTSCGHLFCWTCLYEWLHVHSHQKECPVCKGLVSDNAIIPIYGRGSTQDPNKTSKGQQSGNVPPRPHARRIDRMRHWQDRGSGAWARVVRDDEDVNRGSWARVARDEVDVSRDGRLEENRETGLRITGNVGSDVGHAAEHILHRLIVAERLQREHSEERLRRRQRLLSRRGVPVGASALLSRAGSTTNLSEELQGRVGQRGDLFHDREQILTQMAINRLQRADRSAAIRARLATMDGLLEDLSSIRTRGASPVHSESSRIAANEEVVAGQNVQEVTELFLVEENMTHRSTHATEPGNAMSSNAQSAEGMAEPVQRRRRHGADGDASGSADAESGILHTRKRRRLN